MKVFVTGAAGYIGSVVTERLVEDGFDVVAFDNLKNGHRAAIHPKAKFVHGDLLDSRALHEALLNQGFDAVVHLAAEALIDESIRNPGLFFRANMVGGINLLDAMVAAGVKRMVFSSTAAVYGEPRQIPITEDDPHDPVNAYGESKLQFERAMAWYRRSFGLQHISFRYFNACGASARYGEHRERETHIIPLLFETALGHREKFTLFGTDYDTPDGTCVRDYVHVIDIANAHIAGLKRIDAIGAGAYNLGSKTGHTNRQVVTTVEEVIGKSLNVLDGERRPGDPARLVASNDRAIHDLNWTREFSDLKSMVESAWEWRKGHPNGYSA